MFDLTGRTALITGAGQGLGAVTAEVLAAQGAAVVINDLVQERADEVVAGIISTGGRAACAVADITDRWALAAAIAGAQESLGSEVDILVNNAGIPAEGISMESFVDSDPATWKRHIELNGYGVLNATHLVLPAMIAKGWGRIVTITSDGGRVGDPNIVVYAGAKAMGPGFMRSLSKEVGQVGITCNCISLGTFRPKSDQDSAPVDDDRIARMSRKYAMRRLGQAEDIAPAILLLVSDEGSWITGQTIPVNGGYATS